MDIAKYLEVGDNEIIVNSKNFHKNSTPGINILSQIIRKNDSVLFSSDENWRVRKVNASKWVNVELKENPLEIISPNFTTNRKSWIER